LGILGRLTQVSNGHADLVAVSSLTETFQFAPLPFANFIADLKQLNRLILIGLTGIDNDNDFFALFYCLLIAVRSILDLALRKSFLDRFYHAAHGIDSVEILVTLSLQLVGQGLYKIRACQGVHGIDHAALVGNDLLSSKRNSRTPFCKIGRASCRGTVQ